MDRGPAQRAMTARLKAQVKFASRRRRGAIVVEKIVKEFAVPCTAASHVAEDSISGLSHLRNDIFQGSSSTNIQNGESCSTTTPEEAGTPFQHGTDLGVQRDNVNAPSELELGFIVAYMDYVMPILFPHYRPLIISGGRSWILSLSMSSRSFLRSLVSLSSMLLSTIPAEISPGHKECASKTWEELRNQADMALASMQHDLADITGRGVPNCLADSVQLLASIMQLLTLELCITPPKKWQIHFNAAIGLFEQIMDHHSRDDRTPDMCVILDKLGRPSWAPKNLFSTNQCVFRFFSSMLIFSDVIASTSLGRSPRLRAYLPALGRAERGQRPVVSSEEIFGCQDWLIPILGDIATLSEWKRERSVAGRVPRSELVHRVDQLNERIEAGLRRSMGRCNKAEGETEPSRPLEMLFNQSTSIYGPPKMFPDAQTTLTRIWANAIRTYLYAVMTEGRLEDSNIRCSVEEAICLILEVKSPLWLRSLIWPLCIIGCYATEEQRPIVKTVVDRLGALGSFGTGRLTFEILQDVWKQRDAGQEFCEPSACLQHSKNAVLLL